MHDCERPANALAEEHRPQVTTLIGTADSSVGALPRRFTRTRSKNRSLNNTSESLVVIVQYMAKRNKLLNWVLGVLTVVVGGVILALVTSLILTEETPTSSPDLVILSFDVEPVSDGSPSSQFLPDDTFQTTITVGNEGGEAASRCRVIWQWRTGREAQSAEFGLLSNGSHTETFGTRTYEPGTYTTTAVVHCARAVSSEEVERTITVEDSVLNQNHRLEPLEKP